MKIGMSCALAAGMLMFGGAAGVRADQLFGPVQPYLSFNDSPFKGMSFSNFELISMTNLPDGAFSVAGVSASNNPTVVGPGGAIDSVDGAGNNGHSLFSGCGVCGITFTFDANALGFLPTDAGIVWTDGLLLVHFSAIDANGNTIGPINDDTCCDFGSGDGNPKNYRFFGAEAAAGIKSITISNDGGGIEVDHLQFGALGSPNGGPVPEPATAGLLLTSGFFLAAAAWRRRRS